MRDNNKFRVGTFFLNPPECGFVSSGIGVAQVPQILGVGSFDQAAAVQYFLVGEPDHDIVGRMARAGVIGLKRIGCEVEDGIFGDQVLCSFLMMLLAELIGEHGGKGFDSFFSVVFQSLGTVAVPMCGQADGHRLMMFLLDAVQQGLALCGIPGRVEQHHAFPGDQVHAMGGNACAFIQVIGGIDMEVAAKLFDLEFCFIGLCLSAGQGEEENEHVEDSAHGIEFAVWECGLTVGKAEDKDMSYSTHRLICVLRLGPSCLGLKVRY